MLIMELHRLVPYKKDSYVHFCPHNMPNVRIRKIELVGSVTSIKRIDNMLYLTSKQKKSKKNDKYTEKYNIYIYIYDIKIHLEFNICS